MSFAVSLQIVLALIIFYFAGVYFTDEEIDLEQPQEIIDLREKLKNGQKYVRDIFGKIWSKIMNLGTPPPNKRRRRGKLQ